MEKTIERIRLILTLNNRGINSKFANKYDAELLMNRIAELEKKEIPKPNEKQYFIQEELIRNSSFDDYFKQLNGTDEIPLHEIENLLEEFSEENEKITDCKYEHVLKSLRQSGLTKKYDYLKYFSDQPFNQEMTDLIISNLNLFHSYSKSRFSKLSSDEIQLFLKPYISHSELIPLESIKRACEIISEDENIKNLIQFLFENEVVDVTLNIADYERIKENSYQIKQSITYIIEFLNEDIPDNSQIFSHFIKQWVANGCNSYDLKVIKEKVTELKLDELASAFETRISYINLVFGNKIKNITLSNEPEYRKDLLIYAITHNKKRFIQLIEDNYDVFSSLSSRSILFNEDFYSQHVNINSLNVQNLKDCSNMSIIQRIWDISILGVKSYTFEEIKALYKLPEQYINLYNQLSIPKIDYKLITFKQLTKRKLLLSTLGDEDISILADKLSQKSLSRWLETDLLHIKDLQYDQAIQLLISYDSVEKFIPQVNNNIEVMFLLDNQERIQDCDNLDEVKSKSLEIDKSWCLLRERLSISNQFIDEYQIQIQNFIFQNGTNVALTYYDNLESSTQRESFKRIIKAELMGKFNMLKYFEDDLSREIHYNISKKQKDLWSENIEKTENNILVEESDNFYKTMMLGIVPIRTCLSYIDGKYKDCLLSCFDSNKKFLYASINGKIVGKAILRLTKGKYNNLNGNQGDSVSFVDVENIPDNEEINSEYGSDEMLTLFLEKPYVAHVSPNIANKIIEMFIKIAEEKADLLNAVLVLSDTYTEIKDKESYTRTKFYLYISQSKAGAQYFDSLDGSAFVSDEGSYRSNSFLIRQKNIVHE